MEWLKAVAGESIIVSSGYANTLPLAPGDIFTLTVGDANWMMSAGVSSLALSRLASFQSSLNVAAGFQKLPGGFIAQWVTGTSDSNGNLNLALPVAFPNQVLGGIANEAAPGGWVSNSTTSWAFDLSASTLSTAYARVRTTTGTNGPVATGGTFGRILVWGR